MGCDMRILQMEGAKDPDEYIIKYGSARFQNLIEKAISVLEFKVKLLKNDLNIENVNDKIKFLNEIAKIISKIENTMEREIYIEKIAKEYDISKEAIYAEVNKLTYSNNQGSKILEKTRPVVRTIKQEQKEVSPKIKKRENTILSILLSGDINIFQIIRQNINAEDFKYEINKNIAKEIYKQFDSGNTNVNSIINMLGEEEKNHITAIMAEDYEIDTNNIEKAIDDIIQSYEREKLTERKMEILKLLDDTSGEERSKLENELNNIIIGLAKLK